MIEQLIFRFLARYKYKVKIARPSTLINLNRIKFGQNCEIESFCTLKGGHSNKYQLILGDNVKIRQGAYIGSSHNTIEIKKNGYVGQFSWIGGKGNITIEENVLIAMHVVIISSNHDYFHIPVPYYTGPEMEATIHIGKNVWIGAGSIILPGINIGDGSVIGAGSVVTHDVPKNTIFVGNPAKYLRTIKR